MTTSTRGSITSEDIRLEDLRAVLTDRTDPGDYPHADGVVEEVLIYDAARLPIPHDHLHRRGDLHEEFVRALSDGPGIVVFRNAFRRPVVDAVTTAFDAVIAEQRASGAAAGDHFAEPGANDRVWNALEKLALRAPDAFVDYYANAVLELVATAWLGPDHQVTSQVNVVHPGGQAQVGHRDYHLGFLPEEQIRRYPAHVHRLSPVLTLQGAVAHSTMPVESGPTLYLPHSQKYEPGYLAMHRPEFRGFFEDHHVQLPMDTGDAVFFNPAVVHAAGSNRTTDRHRMANLLQISSAFGRAMETVDRERICNAVYPVLLQRDTAAGRPYVDRVIRTAAEGYPFPTNLDRDPPVDGLAPPSQADVLRQAVAERWEPDSLRAALAEHATRRRTG
jgi:ectoine hydroxylase-related dioxygenase (phytanoyl-CoA dioxygenase family)